MTSSALTRETTCPACGAAMLDELRFARWCEACGWNLKPTQAAADGLLDRLNLGLAARLGRGLEAEMIARANLRPRFTIAKLAAYALALPVHLLTLLVVLVAVRSFLEGGLAIVLGLVLLVVAWVIRPRVTGVPRGTVGRADAPALFGLLDRIAASVGTRPPDRVYVEADFNLWFARLGWRRTRTVGIGLAVFEVLDAQERVAGLAHELAHDVNGDSTRGLIIGSAIQTLVEWHDLVMPESLDSGDRGLYGLFAIPVNVVLVGVALLLRLVVMGFVLLLCRDGQRAEYLADSLGARTAGTEPMASALTTLGLGDNFASRLGGAVLDRRFLDTWQVAVRELSDRERERIRRVSELEASMLTASHPPTAARLRVIRGRPFEAGSVVLGPEESAAIDRELRALPLPDPEDDPS